MKIKSAITNIIEIKSLTKNPFTEKACIHSCLAEENKWYLLTGFKNNI